MNFNIRVGWFGAHPFNHSLSMDVYRLALVSVTKKKCFKSCCDVKAWPTEQLVFRKKNRLLKAFGDYISYPVRIFFQSRSLGITHFLDHSSAHLIPWVSKNSKTIVTLHDLIPLRYKGELNPRQIERFRKKVENLKNADAIIAVSEYSKKEAIELLGCQSEKIFVVPNGVEPALPEYTEIECIQRMRALGCAGVVMSVGSNIPRKNLVVLPDALAKAKSVTGGPIGLVRVGERLPDWLSVELKASLGEDYFVELGRVDQSTLNAVYQSIDVVVIPSLYEGFGLPVLEAFAAGKAVACSKTSSLPEVGGEEAEYFDPESGSEVGEAIGRCLAGLSNKVAAERRKKVAEHYNWERHVRAVFSVYEIILKEVD